MEHASHLLWRLWGHLVPCYHLLTVKSGPIHSGLFCLGVEAVFWNSVMKLEDHKTLYCLSCSSSVWCSLLGKKRKLKKSSCMCESMCTRCSFSEDTSSNASLGAIFRYPFSQQCCLKIQFRLLIGIFITILSTAPAWMLLQMMLFLEAVAMVTINPFAWEESIHRMFYFPQNALWCVKAYMYSETEIKNGVHFVPK